jgi:hypothetical protein
MKKVIYLVICMALLFTTMMTACSQPAQPAAPAKPAAATEAPKPVAPAPAAPVVPPQQPAAQPQPVEKPTSFESAAYSNDKYGFTLKYPKKWIKKDASGDMVFWVTASEQITGDAAWVSVIPKTADYTGAMKESLSQYPGFMGLTGNAKFVAVTPITLADGKTAANESTAAFKVMTYNPTVYGLAIDKGTNTIIVMGVTVGDAGQLGLLKELAQTITFK